MEKMSKGTCKILIHNYPTLYPENFKCNIGRGWFGLVNNLSYEISKIVSYSNGNLIVAVDEIKETKGELRFYCTISEKLTLLRHINFKFMSLCAKLDIMVLYNTIQTIRQRFYKTSMEQVSELIYRYCKKSTSICEICGDPGECKLFNMKKKTLCKKCREEEESNAHR